MDTNVLVSAALTPGICRTIRAEARRRRFEAVISPAVLEEFQQALRRLGALPETIGEAVQVVRGVCEVTDVQPTRVPEGFGAADRRLVGQAIAAGAEYFVTGDKEILERAADLPVKVVSPRTFLELLTKR